MNWAISLSYMKISVPAFFVQLYFKSSLSYETEKRDIELTVKQWIVLPVLNKAVDFTAALSVGNWGHFVGLRTCLWKTVTRSRRFLTTRKQEKTPFVFGWLVLMSLADLYSSGWFVLEFKSSVARATSKAHASYACYFHSGITKVCFRSQKRNNCFTHNFPRLSGKSDRPKDTSANSFCKRQ